VSTSVTLGATIVATAGNAGADWVLITGAVRTTTAGNLSFQWAQVASNANAANVGAGAFIEAKKAV
jgi:hypothetical protein